MRARRLAFDNESGSRPMGNHRSSHRKSRQFAFTCIIGTALFLGCFLVWHALTPATPILPKSGDQRGQHNLFLRELNREPAARPVFPYSVVPGGVASAAELK